MRKYSDITGQRYGYLTVVEFSHILSGHAYWKCLCDCGNSTIVRGSHLKSNHTFSCGCKRGNPTHAESKTRLYNIWNNMRERCSNAKNPQYKDYGARGISVCDDWCNFELFRAWALSSGYSESLTIDRIENDKGYYPENCRWATSIQQANNTRKTRLITYNDETHSVSEWARILNIKQSTLNMRLNKYGWSVDKALGKDTRKHGS